VATILVVDDEPSIRQLVRLTLGMDGHEVLEASDGRQALEEVAQRRPDLILLDVMMPALSGWDTLASLKASRDADVRQIPVLMLTALTTPTDRAKGGIEGAVRYLTKPIAPDDLTNAVNETLAGEPEPVQRRKAQQRALEDIARMERGAERTAGDAGAGGTRERRPRLTSLEGSRPVAGRRTPAPGSLPPGARSKVDELTSKQRELLLAVRRSPTVLGAAASLGMSRSNVYASLRRIARRLEIRSVADLLDHIRAGHLD
jgi:CheY-like chemotaxis protein